MRAPLIALVLVALGAGGYYFFQQSQALSAAPAGANAPEASALPQTDGSAALALFNDICIEGQENFALTEARATAGGWTVAADDVHPATARIAAIARGADVGASNTVLNVYAHPERSEYIMLTDLTISGDRLNGCYVYDFQAAGIPDLGALQSRLGAAAQPESHPGVIESRQWTRPPAFPSVATVRVGYIPRGSPVEAQAGFTGLAIAVTSMSR